VLKDVLRPTPDQGQSLRESMEGLSKQRLMASNCLEHGVRASAAEAAAAALDGDDPVPVDEARAK
jgi:hypothetical protein